MQILSKGYPIVVLEQFIHTTFSIFSISQFIGDIDIPMLEHRVQSLDPFRNTSFTCIDFLTASNETNDDSPVFTLVERPNQEFRFRHREVSHFQFIAVRTTSFQIVSNTLVCPTALCLIKDSYMFHLAIPRVLQMDSFLWVNLHNAILYRILNLGQHIVTIAVNNLNEFTYFTS